jgi:hypothetical protein
MEQLESPLYSEAELERWDREWLNYLLREYPQQLSPHTVYPYRPELPDDPLQTMNVSVGNDTFLQMYAPGSAIMGRKVMEFGCGCGNLGKLIAHYADSYLGLDCSRLALAVGRLVSPANAAYVHVNELGELGRMTATVDTWVSRFFWIHQNLAMGPRVIRIGQPLLKTGGRLYMDFFWPNPAEAVGFWRTDVWRKHSPDDLLDKESSARTARSAAKRAGTGGEKGHFLRS